MKKTRSAIATVSLGYAWEHDLFKKLDAAASSGFEAVEVFYQDLEYLAKTLPGGLTRENRLEAARQIRSCCDKNQLTVMVLQSFQGYEGLVDRDIHKARIEEMHMWFELIKILGTDLIQIPTQFFQEGTTGDMDVIVADMIEVADLGLQQTPPVRFAYEGVAWGVHIDTWEGTWEVVQRVARPNFGLCLDTFHVAGRAWGDPTAISGRLIDADERLRVSLARMVKELDGQKVFYVQVGDAAKLTPPLNQKHTFYSAQQPSRMSWSRNARLFAFEESRGGYLPILDVTRAIVDGVGYRGWLSMELFNVSLGESQSDVPVRHAERAATAWDKLMEHIKWE